MQNIVFTLKSIERAYSEPYIIAHKQGTPLIPALNIALGRQRQEISEFGGSLAIEKVQDGQSYTEKLP